jgi:HEAT repeats
MTDRLSPDSSDPVAALRALIAGGTASDVAAWTATGEAGVTLLRDVLAGHRHLELPGLHQRAVLDGLATAVAQIANAHPEAFLVVFADPAFDSDSYVMTGLGYVNDPRATERLARAARSDDQWLRMEAAVGLGRHSSAIAVESLTALLSDREYLVRYHALRGLGAVGDQSAVAALRGFRGESDVEQDLAKQALEAIARRGSRAPTHRRKPPTTVIG